MVNTCYVPLCNTGYKKRLKKGACASTEKIPIFSFPLKKPDVLKKWIRFLNRNDNALPKHGGVCAKHFEERYLKIGERITLNWALNPVPSVYTNTEFIPPSVLPTPTTSRKSPTRRNIVPDEIDCFKVQDEIHNLSDITDDLCPEGYIFHKFHNEVTFFKLSHGKNGALLISEAITIQDDLHVKLYSYGSPIPLPEWFIKGNTRCKVTLKSVLENFPPYIKCFSENKPEKQVLSDNFVDEIINIRYKKPDHGPKYSKELIQLSLMIRYTSASSYRLLSQYFPFPSMSHLNHLCRGDVDPIKAIKILFEKQKIDRDVVLLMDEMYLQKEVQYQEGKLFGIDESGTMVRGIMTFMIVGLRNNIPFVIKAIPESKIEGSWLAEHISDCIRSLHDAGLQVRAVISDNHTTNVAAFKELWKKYGKIEQENAIRHPTNKELKIYLFYDAVHLMKNIRNNLLNTKRFIFPSFKSSFINIPSGEITWKLIHDVYDRDKNLQAHLRKAHKLTFKALHPGDNKQSVPLALCIFDPTTSAALENYFPDRVDAAAFLRLINMWWTMSNSKSQFKNNFHVGDAIKVNDSKPEFFRHLAQWVSEWTLVQSSNSEKFTLSKQTSSALIVTLKCTASLIEDLLQEQYSYILTARFHTDPLELRFSKYRQMSGGRFLVGLREVNTAERILLMKSLLKESVSITDENIHVDSDAENELRKFQEEINKINHEIDDCYLDENSIEVATLISGYIAKKLFDQFSCMKCKASMTLNDSTAAELHPENKYLLTLSRGGLQIPKIDLIQYVSKSFAILELTFKLIQDSKVSERKAAEHVLLSNSFPLSFFCEDHGSRVKVINRKICNIFFNNYQKLQKDKVRFDSIKSFKHRQSKRRRED